MKTFFSLLFLCWAIGVHAQFKFEKGDILIGLGVQAQPSIGTYSQLRNLSPTLDLGYFVSDRLVLGINGD